jgi:hypothetical protein
MDGNMNLVKGTCKRIIFSFTLPKFAEPIQFHVENLDFNNNKFVHWCGLQVKKVGLNPNPHCFKTITKPMAREKEESVLPHPPLHWRGGEGELPSQTLKSHLIKMGVALKLA